MTAEATGPEDLGPVDKLLRGVAKDPVQWMRLGLQLDALRLGGAAERDIAALREELDALRAEMAEHKQRQAELEALVKGLSAALHSNREAAAAVELSAEERAAMDRLAEWPFLDGYPPVADP